MAITLKPMSINAGDPVTSDLLGLIIQNLQTVAKGETVSNIAVDASGLSNALDPTNKTTIAYNTVVAVPSSVNIKSSTAGGTPKNVPYGKTFVGTPEVWVQINAPTALSWANSQVFPQVVSVGATSCKLLFRTSTANGTLKFTLFVTGQLA
jgi:hypothetical protein